jgi:glycosyltransferase involved in cell wall biosynthesis
MKLLLVNYEFPPAGGGAANATAFLARALAQQGHAVTVLTAACGGLRGTAVEHGYTVVRARALRRRVDRSNMTEMLTFLGSGLVRGMGLARRERFDAAIAFFTLPSGPIAWLLRAAFGTPYVVSLRGGDVPGIVPQLGPLHRMMMPLRRAVLRGACAVVANSESLARLSQAADPIAVAVIPNGVDHDAFAPAQGGAPDACEPDRGARFRIVFVGRLHEQKNVHLLIDSTAALAALPGPSVSLEIIGDGPERPALVARAAALGLGTRARFAGWLEKASIAAALRRADVFVNPSSYEGMPNAVLEAMASALPVVVSRVGGNDEVVVHEVTGLLFDLGLPDGLTAVLQRLRLDPKLGDALGGRARSQVAATFHWADVASRYVALLPGHGA